MVTSRLYRRTRGNTNKGFLFIRGLKNVVSQFERTAKKKMTRKQTGDRGCVFFNFGLEYIVRLLVAICSLRKFYDGPISVIVRAGEPDGRLLEALSDLNVSVVEVEGLSKSFDRHRLFQESPYETTISLDSDLLFLSPIDPLWDPLEEAGVLVTRFFAPPYGVDGDERNPGFSNRVEFLAAVRPLLGEDLFQEARRRMLDERIDINIGVMGLTKNRGGSFLAEYAGLMARGRATGALLLDEMLAIGLVAKHHHALLDEAWNCPADEFFRRTNLADARILHYFAEGHSVHGIKLGRNPDSWAGKKWDRAFRETEAKVDLRPWLEHDPLFRGARPSWRSVVAGLRLRR